MYIVYCHTNKINGKRYVGITQQKPVDRWKNGRGYEGQHFYKAIQKYGWEEFTHEILFTDLTKEEAEEKEIYLIKKWKLTNRKYGYNITPGGTCGIPLSDKTKHKISLKKKGQKLSEITKHRMSQSRMGANHFHSIPVLQYDDDGNFIARYCNSREAMDITGIEARNIRSCIEGKRYHAGGYVWKGEKNERNKSISSIIGRD